MKTPNIFKLRLFLSQKKAEFLYKKNNLVQAADLRGYQLQKINELISYVMSNNEFYKEFYKKNNLTTPVKCEHLLDLNKLPILTKEMFRENARTDAFISSPFTKSSLEGHKTTGSTGSPITVYSDSLSSLLKSKTLDNIWRKIKNKAYYRELRLWRRKEFEGFEKLRAENNLLYNLDVFDLDASISKEQNYVQGYLDKVYEFNPQVIRGYTSALYTLGQHIDKNRLNQLKVVIASAESLPLNLWNQLERMFGKPVINLYGGTEATAIGVSSFESKRILLSENLYFIELIDEKGNVAKPNTPARILITDLHNKAFPLIRYEIGDVAIGDDDFFRLTDGYRHFVSVEGRTNDIFTLPGGKLLYSHFWQNYLREKNFVTRFQVVQEDINNIVLRLQFKEKNNSSNIELIKKELTEKLPGIQFRIVESDEFELGAGGKFSAIASKIKVDFNNINS